MIPRAKLEQLLELARVTESVELEIKTDCSTDSMMRMADEGKSFDFWLAPEENMHSEEVGGTGWAIGNIVKPWSDARAG